MNLSDCLKNNNFVQSDLAAMQASVKQAVADGMERKAAEVRAAEAMLRSYEMEKRSVERQIVEQYKARGGAEGMAEAASEREAIQAEQQLDEHLDDILDARATTLDEFERWLGGKDETAEVRTEGDAEPADASAPRPGDQQDAGQGQGQAGDPGQASAPILERPTPDDLRARDDAARAADEQRRSDEQRAAADAQRSDFTLTGSNRPADQAEARGQGTLYSNPFFDPAVWAQASKDAGFAVKTIVEALGKVFDWEPVASRSLVKGMKELAADFSKSGSKHMHMGGPIMRFYRYFFESAGTDMYAIAKRSGSATMADLVKKFHQVAGDMTGQAETAPQRVEYEWNRMMSPVARALEKVEQMAKTAGRDPAQVMEQVANLVRNPRNIRPGNAIHDAAASIRETLDGALKYMRDAGMEVGEVKDGYYPREYNADMVRDDYEGFISGAAQAYRESGLDQATARMAAEELALTLTFGPDSIFRPDLGKPNADFMKGRVFGKQVDDPKHPLHKFIEHDPRVGIASYLQRAVRRAEVARVIGEKPEQWAELRGKMIDEGASPETIEALGDFIQTVGGLRGDKGLGRRGQAAVSWLRTIGTLMFLEKATMTSIPEMIMPAIRSGNILDMHRSVATTFKALFKKSSGDIQALTELADDLGILSAHMGDTVMSNRWHGGDVSSTTQTKIMERHFKMTGLTQYTEATRMGSLAVGQTFMRRLVNGIGGKLNRDYLGEVGVPADKVDAFATWLKQTNDGMPSAADLRAAPADMRKLYTTALRKFEADSIMRPNMTTRPQWMNKPVLGLLGQLQSYNYAFYNHVLKRVGKNAWKGLTDADYDTVERMRLAYPLLMLPMLAAMQGLVGEGRDLLFGDPEKEMDIEKKLIRALDRGIPVAPASPLINIVSGAKYQRSAVETAAGPAFGTFGRALDAYVDYWFKNTEGTNTQERAVARNFFDVVLEPTAAVALSYAFGQAGGLPGQLTYAAGRQAVGSGQVRDVFMDQVAGEKKKKGDSVAVGGF